MRRAAKLRWRTTGEERERGGERGENRIKIRWDPQMRGEDKNLLFLGAWHCYLRVHLKWESIWELCWS